jgi:hypothetical protein
MMMKIGLAKNVRGTEVLGKKTKKKWYILSPYSYFLFLWNGILSMAGFYFLFVQTTM